jgi:hypothetical protein
MMTADFVSGRLAWHSSIVSNDRIREVKGKGKKEKKEKPTVDISGLKKMSESKVSDLDNLVASMEARDVLPPSGTGLKAKAKPRIAKEDIIIDRIAAKYGIAKKPTKRKASKS